MTFRGVATWIPCGFSTHRKRESMTRDDHQSNKGTRRTNNFPSRNSPHETNRTRNLADLSFLERRMVPSWVPRERGSSHKACAVTIKIVYGHRPSLRIPGESTNFLETKLEDKRRDGWPRQKGLILPFLHRGSKQHTVFTFPVTKNRT